MKMTPPRYSSFVQWFRGGPFAPYVRTIKSSGGFLNLIETAMPAVEMSDPAVPELVLHHDLRGGFGVSADLGSGRFNATTQRGHFFLAAPSFANSIRVDSDHQIRSIAFPVSSWSHMFENAPNRASSLDFGALHRGAFTSPRIRSLQHQLWRLCDEEGVPSRLLAQAAGCEILAELCRLAGSPLTTARGGLAPWAERRCLELMRARLSEDITLDELAAEAELSTFHFARMFKQSLRMPPRVYLTRLRVEKACELLEQTDLPITQIALEVGYSSNQVLARVFLKHRHTSPSEYRRAVRGGPRLAPS
ncbi:transcriptional regulator, AraC family [Palleronia marisminoris]|uniref:Right origin-binding protein n=1 Tax=Palleronia marisminoris TaxID=315423 RepID=A0A1Y5TN44_9RHOB|nr:AraC family transcriptional regulator [Palleronia marisminoris]SFH45571.1 transcriptional regulator, AraC family [Palleronia marisminoris]SLN67957.1 Right origin-binding protein [Palleronia marisminoris]